ncbi:ABC transporter ATP-binding protein [Caldilinea sp.]|uniref:ABC transporter ATP-binding protein n=1 Tax=Caldilinea sp. TaxID=2293560 RepID=UPI0021DC3D88|nr:ABC transporter ATP-binding protein [Caldilinea sp.]GIV70392.1 MAG: ABC transporter ATP-binding protein [Caldilinea sp.]
MIRIKNVSAYYQTVHGTVRAVENVSFNIYDNEILGIAGESGCGKTTLMKTIYGNIESPMYIANGSIELEVEEMGEQKVIPNQEIHRYWWDYISYIPQASMSVLNPVVRIKDQFLDSYLRPEMRALGKQALLKRMAAYLEELELPPEVLDAFPHQLSGGMRQRVIVALATFVHPKFVLADEPTTALDVVVQRGILTMLMNLQKQLQNTFVIVSHDMGVHYQTTHRMVIMYAGKVAEIAPTDVLFERPQHPYTEMLINSLPRLGDDQQRTGIGGRPPSLLNPPSGCRFADRCYLADAHCREVQPELVELEPGHFVACLKRTSAYSLNAAESRFRGDASK